MEERRFDALTRALGTATSRRQVLKGLLGGIAAAIVGGAVEIPRAEAAGCSKKTCIQKAQEQAINYQSTVCNSICHDPKLVVGCFGCQLTLSRLYRKWVQDCKQGDGCLRVADEVCCFGECVHTGNDRRNCGACAHACKPGEVCDHGQCKCGEHGTMCDGQCVDTQIDKYHCGSCDHACGTCETCINGQCAEVDCGPSKVCCKDQCVDLCSGEPPNPNTCECDPCKGKTDGTSCGPTGDLICCSEQCVSTASDNDHCGGCAPCRADQICSGSTCMCPPGTEECNGKCIDTDSDPNNCGQCGKACTGGQKCCGGECKDDCGCPQDRIQCNGVCCDANEICVDGTCQKPTGCNPGCADDEICCNEFGILDSTGHTETWVCKKTSEYKICPVSKQTPCNGCRDNWICCPIDLECCGGTGNLYAICGGDGISCCAAGTIECGPLCCSGDWDHAHCGIDENNQYYCA